MGATRVPVTLGLLHEWMRLPPTVQVLAVEAGSDGVMFKVICEGDEVPDAPEANLITTRTEVGGEVVYTHEWWAQGELS